jgi:hypothetical protein
MATINYSSDSLGDGALDRAFEDELTAIRKTRGELA